VTPRRAAFLAGGVMLVVYVLTLAPTVTFWDAGEFIASAKVLGIPHPPGTPLFIVLLNAWARALSFLPFAVATNLFSAVSTAIAVALTAWLIARVAPSPWVGLAAITAGAMTSVWQNATETEVYAASLALSVGLIVTADIAGRTGERRWIVLTAYLIALSVPLHLSALVAAPAAVYLVARRSDGATDWTAASTVAGAATIAFAVSRLSAAWCAAGALLFLVAAMIHRRDTSARASGTPAGAALATVVALSGVLFLLLRARHDPGINQGNPATWASLGDVITRRQYAVQGLWPRQAPIWLQLANWFEYADWQFALGLGPTVIPTVSRVVATLGFASLGVVGMQWHRKFDRRTWAGLAILFASGSLGVLIYLNLKAGASFAWQLVTGGAGHEARDRDYFFVLGFWVWGVWAGIGAFALARRWRLPAVTAVAALALPLALNWAAVSRRGEPEASLPREVAATLLDSLPRNAVLFVAGDNDSYPLWYAQQVEHRRQDVTVVTLPLLAAPWYVDELRRRHGLEMPLELPKMGRAAPVTRGVASEISRAAAARARAVAVALTVPTAERNLLADLWTVSGVFAVANTSSFNDATGLNANSMVVVVDSQRLRQAMQSIERWRRGRTARPSIDPVNDDFLHTLSCPSLILDQSAKRLPAASLDSTCNLR
jgi:hypothetical protein